MHMKFQQFSQHIQNFFFNRVEIHYQARMVMLTFESIRKMQCKFYIFSLKNSKIFVSIPLMNKNVWRQSAYRMELCYVKINKNFYE